MSGQTVSILSGRWPDLVHGTVVLSDTQQAQTPSIGCVMPAHNCADTVIYSARSVLSGMGPHDRLAITENGSTDATWEVICQSLTADPRVRIARRDKGDAAAARNACLALLDTEYVAFCDADDEWAPGKMAGLRAILAATGSDVLIHPMLLYRATGSHGPVIADEFATKRLPRRQGFLEDLIACGDFLPTSATILRRSCIPVPLFSDGLLQTQDYEAWCWFARHNPQPVFTYVDAPLSYHRLGNGLSKAALRRIIHALQIVGSYGAATSRPTAVYAFVRMAIAGLRNGHRAGQLVATMAAILGMIFADRPPDPRFRGRVPLTEQRADGTSRTEMLPVSEVAKRQ